MKTVINSVKNDMSLKRSLVLALFFFVLPIGAYADPVISGTTDISVPATSTSGAVVTFSPTATDSIDTTDPVTCSPASGSTFAIGTTTVTCTSSNSAFATTTATFRVGVSGTIPAYLQVEADTGTIFPKQRLDVGACPNTQSGSDTTVNALCAFSAAGLSTNLTWFPFGAQLDAVAGNAAGTFPYSWLFFLNGDISQVGASGYTLAPNDNILWTLGIQPLRMALSTTSPIVGATTTITVTGFDATQFAFIPVAGATIVGVPSAVTDANGKYDLTATSTDPLTVSVVQTGFLPSASTTITAVAAAITPPPATGGASGNGGSILQGGPFSVVKALAYLSNNQHADGSFGSSVITDWAALAFAAADPGTAKTKLKNYLLTATPALASVTDYERHAMALEALGINPYTGTPTDYITPIVNAFDGTQIGDPALDTDDIFAIFPLLNAGYKPSDPLIQKELIYIISKQKPDGSWNESPDVTAAAIQAIGPFFTLPHYGQSMGAAAAYLLSQSSPTVLNADGGWGSSANSATNIDSTSWVQTAINAIPVDPTHLISWASSAGHVATDVFATAQQADGAVRPLADSIDNRIWSTSYVVVAASGQSWLTILQTFPRPAPITSGGGSSGGGGGFILLSASNSSIATTTQATSTSATVPSQGLFTISSTSTSTPVKIKRLLPKKKTLSKASTTVSLPSLSQTAAVANAPKTHFFSSVWHFVTSWFGKIL